MADSDNTEELLKAEQRINLENDFEISSESDDLNIILSVNGPFHRHQIPFDR
jgi:hypothetical protein